MGCVTVWGFFRSWWMEICLLLVRIKSSWSCRELRVCASMQAGVGDSCMESKQWRWSTVQPREVFTLQCQLLPVEGSLSFPNSFFLNHLCLAVFWESSLCKYTWLCIRTAACKINLNDLWKTNKRIFLLWLASLWFSSARKRGWSPPEATGGEVEYTHLCFCVLLFICELQIKRLKLFLHKKIKSKVHVSPVWPLPPVCVCVTPVEPLMPYLYEACSLRHCSSRTHTHTLEGSWYSRFNTSRTHSVRACVLTGWRQGRSVRTNSVCALKFTHVLLSVPVFVW